MILKFDNGETAAYFSTEIEMPVEMVLETVADRWAIEEFFHDTKETWALASSRFETSGRISPAGTSMRGSMAWWNWSVGTLRLEQLVDRSDRPWDNPDRRPSHADRRREIAHKMLRNRFMAELPASPTNAKNHRTE